MAKAEASKGNYLTSKPHGVSRAVDGMTMSSHQAQKFMQKSCNQLKRSHPVRFHETSSKFLLIQRAKLFITALLKIKKGSYIMGYCDSTQNHQSPVQWGTAFTLCVLLLNT